MSLGLLPASGPAAGFEGSPSRGQIEKRVPEGEREEREIETNPGGHSYYKRNQP
jgi:hypothetical protein